MPPLDKDVKIPASHPFLRSNCRRLSFPLIQQCPTPQHLQAELDALATVLELREQEDTWEKMERAIIRFTGVTRGGGYKHLPLFVDGLGKMGVGLKIGQCMLSDRGRLSGVATDLLQTLAPRLSSHFSPLTPIYLPPLIQLLGRPNKVFLKRAEKCLWTIIAHCHLPTILFELKRGLSDDAATCRRGCAAGFERALIDWEKEVFGEKGVGWVEEALRRVGTDKDPEVRGTGKRIWGKFAEIWPERVDEFSGPLTPTIRRYLGVAAGAATTSAGPSKPKAARPLAARPPPPALTASTSSAGAQVSTEPIAHVRVQALAGSRAVRPLPAPVPATVVMEEPQSHYQAIGTSESTRARRSPIKPTNTAILSASSSTSSFPSVPTTATATTMGAAPGPALPLDPSETRQRVHSTRAPRYPPGVLGHAGRSVSHQVLSLAASIPLPDAGDREREREREFPFTASHNPLGGPARPAFPTSYSTTHLPTDSTSTSTEGWHPTRRLPGAAPARVIRPAPLFTTDEASAPQSQSQSFQGGTLLPPTTPHVLRGAVKSSQPAHTRRALGQAQRRAVTAPMPPCPPPPEVEYTPVPPTGALRSSPGVRDRVMQMEQRAAAAGADAGGDGMDAATIPLPVSPVAEKFAMGLGSNKATPRGGKVDPRVEMGEMVDSPVMPILTASMIRSKAVEGDGRLLDEEAIPEDAGMANMTISEGVQRGDGGNLAEDVQMEGIREAAIPMDISEEGGSAALPTTDTPLELPVEAMVNQQLQIESHTIDTPASTTMTTTCTSESAGKEAPVGPAAISRPIANATSSSSSTQTRKAPAHASAPALVAASRSRPEKPAATVSASTKLPPVTAVRGVKPRVPSASEARRPFRPTTAPKNPVSVGTAAKCTQVDSSTAPSTSVVRASKPPVPTAKPTIPVSKPSTNISRPPPTQPVSNPAADVKPSTSTTAGPRTAGSNLTRPTAASAHRIASTGITAATTRVSKPPPSSSSTLSTVSSTVTLPPIKKEKIKRKAAVPSFRPVRNAGAASITTRTASGSASLANSITSSSLASSQTQRSAGTAGRPIVAKVKVKPEAIALPPSPGETRATEIPLPPSPVVGEFTGKVKVKIRQEDVNVVALTKMKEVENVGMVEAERLNGEKSVSPLGVRIALPGSPNLADRADLPVEAAAAAAVPSTTMTSDVVPAAELSEPGSSVASPPKSVGYVHVSSAHAWTDRTPVSKASTAPPMSDWNGSPCNTDEEEEEEEEEELGEERVTFSRKPSGPVEGVMTGWTRRSADIGTEGNGNGKDLMEFSAPSRSAHSTKSNENEENRKGLGVVSSGVKDLPDVTGACASPRVALSKRDVNEVMRVDEIVNV